MSLSKNDASAQDLSFDSTNPVLINDPQDSVYTEETLPAFSRLSATFQRDSGGDAEYLRPFKPQLTAMWHPQAGLFASPNMRYIPAVDRNARKHPNNITQPINIDDTNIWQAFRPHTVDFRCDRVFQRFFPTTELVAQHIQQFPNGSFGLDVQLRNRWVRVETMLTTMAAKLISFPHLPWVNPPKFPTEYGYCDLYKEKAKATLSAFHARDSFIDLGAYLSFTLALYLRDTNGSCTPAFNRLKRVEHQLPTFTQDEIDFISQSHVCRFEPNFRIGGVFKPLEGYWPSRMKMFINANVPVWHHWGKNIDNLPSPADRVLREYFPPPDVIRQAQARARAVIEAKDAGYDFYPYGRTPSSAGEDNCYSNASEAILYVPLGSSSSSHLPSDYEHSSSLTGMLYDEHESSETPTRSMLPSQSASEYPTSQSILYSVAEAQRKGGAGTALSNFVASKPTHSPLSALVPSPSCASQPSYSQSVDGMFERNEKALAELHEYFEKVALDRLKCLAAETPAARQSRLDSEKVARRHHASQAVSYYIWEAKDDGTYERKSLTRMEGQDQFTDFTPNQRRFTSHAHCWDFCPQLPPYSEEHPPGEEPSDDNVSEYSGDDNDEELVDNSQDTRMSSVEKGKGRALADDDVHMSSVRKGKQRARDDEPVSDPIAPHDHTAVQTREKRARDASDNEDVSMLGASHDPSRQNKRSKSSPLQSPPLQGDPVCNNLVSYLKDFFGYNIFSAANVPVPIQGEILPDTPTYSNALLAVGYEDLPEALQPSFLVLINLMSSIARTYSQLPPAFDYSPNCIAPVSLLSSKLDVGVLDGVQRLYVVSKKGQLDAHWVIVIQSPVTLLLIFRNGWSTMEAIALNFVNRGIAFHIADAVRRKPMVPPLAVVSSRLRKFGWTSDRTTYDAYILDRRNLLLQNFGACAALTRGGIVSRIARDVVDIRLVLRGASRNNHILGTFGGFYLVTDKLADFELDTICGVYSIATSKNSSTSKNSVVSSSSWWPPVSLWESQSHSAYPDFQWTPLAEIFYTTRLTAHQNKYETTSLKTWKTRLRKQNKLTVGLKAGAERYQREYVDHCLHQIGSS
ncbi:hypothetical protein BDN70DRAFT_939290 [Pholiota conissans]|uniref:Uncharacterized protein n=1 Tax=Pholiota conissans TaxID=109636 RepID=A0A9P5YJI1_9AGAR|nr:hypothetical protein BDN70DRAFT_939290 [Pholiota conissans]